ncbi:MAG TPA: helix-turn-helix domain-containing protein [Bacteroidia bacterium]|jgi:hypothetical protein|nr:helix-turn-helix domain-containing protein [Bacteroidia bacterium]
MDREILIVLTDKQFNELVGKLDSILHLLENLKVSSPTINNFLSQEKVEEATGLSRGTLLKMRKQGVLRASKLGGKKLYYNPEDFKNLLPGTNG